MAYREKGEAKEDPPFSPDMARNLSFPIFSEDRLSLIWTDKVVPIIVEAAKNGHSAAEVENIDIKMRDQLMAHGKAQGWRVKPIDETSMMIHWSTLIERLTEGPDDYAGRIIFGVCCMLVAIIYGMTKLISWVFGLL